MFGVSSNYKRLYNYKCVLILHLLKSLLFLLAIERDSVTPVSQSSGEF